MSRVLLIIGGTVVDPATSRHGRFDLLLEDGVLLDIQPSLKAREGARIVDADGKLVVPAFVDLHAHFRQPGREDKETIESGARAAIRGGYGTVCVMPNTTPPTDHGSAVEWIKDEGRRVGLIEVLPIGALSRGQQGQELTDFGELFESGCVALSDDGQPLADSLLMRRALEYAKLFGRPVMQHAEDPALSAGGVMHEGRTSTVLGLRGIPGEAETTMVARDLELAQLTGGWLHVSHLSCARSVELIREAKRRGVHVTCEVTPHHLALTEEAVAEFDTVAKVNPPLRTEQDRLALIEGLKDGTIDAIATDHAPHTEWEKDADFDAAPFGIAGLETALGVCVTALVEPKRLSWSQLIEKFSINPARIVGVDGHGLQKGQPVDLTIIDPSARWVVDPAAFVSKAKRSPFTGRTLVGQAVSVIRHGQIHSAQDGWATS